MDSDDSAASEVASDVDAYEDSFAADEIDDIDDLPPPPPVKPTTARTSPGPVVSLPLPVAETDDEYEDDAYSVDFEEPEEPVVVAPKRSPVRRDVPPPAIAEDAEYAYSEASFEDESRLSQSLTNRLVVDLSVPVRRDSSGSASGNSPTGKTSHLVNANSPHVNLKVLSKPSPVAAAPPPPPPAPLRPPVLSVATRTLYEMESNTSLSLLLRKVESKYHDELEDLREKNALLTWKERELKTELRILKDEHKMRKSRLDKKRSRAAERRREAEGIVERLRSDVADLEAKAATAHDRLVQQLETNDALRAAIDQGERERRAIETRNLALAEQLQTTLSDFHALNLKYEAAVGAKVAAERRVDELATQREMACQVLQHKAQIDVDAVVATLAREREAWQTERATLPEHHRVMVEHERERIEKLETQLLQHVRDMEATLARETARFEKELALAHASNVATEARAETRLQSELDKLARERTALDDQRRELMVSMTRGAARIDDERARLDATREQLEVRRVRLVEERAELDTKAAYLEDRVHRLAQEESVLEARKAELTKLGRETLEKSRVLAQRLDAFGELKRELDALRVAHAQLQEAMGARDEQDAALRLEKAALEKTMRQLQHERLMVAKQRVQSRQFLDGAKKLELLLHHQKALEQVKT